MSPDPILINIAEVTSANLADRLSLVGACWKCSSILWMQANDFPVLPGLVLNAWTNEAEQRVLSFCREKNLSELLVRIEKPGERWTQRRGGYTIPLGEVQRQVTELTAEAMLTILLEQGSPYADVYSLTSVCDFQAGRVDVEIVGPGFDASDVLRSDAVPHERYELHLTNEEAVDIRAASFRPKRLQITDPEAYRASVRARLIKIGARLRNPAFPDVLIDASSSAERDRLAAEATDFLKRSGQTLLLDHANEYEPIPNGLFDAFLREALRLFVRVRSSGLDWQLLSLAGSFLPQGRLVFWDFFAPKKDTTALVRL